MFFESLFEGSFRFADVTGFIVAACQLVYYTPHLSWGWSLSLGATNTQYDAPGGGVGLGMGGDTRLPD